MKTVRDGQIVAPYCPECGCRLNTWKINREDEYIYAEHYMGEFLFDIDARGCECTLVNEFWVKQTRLVYGQ